MNVTFYSRIVNFISALQLGLSKPQLWHLLTIMHGIILCEGRKTITGFRKVTRERRDLSCMTRFLSEAPWNHRRINQCRLRFLRQRIEEEREKQAPQERVTFLIVDDTNSVRRPSTKRMERLDYHYAHSEGKTVWSHVVVTLHVVTGALSIPWDFRPYFREDMCKDKGIGFKSKVELARELIEAYPAAPDERVYVLMDSWYSNKDLIDACNARGFHVLAAFKVNRMIYPVGIGIKVSDFASTYIRRADLHSVTVKEDAKYLVYDYEGALSDMENMRVLLCWEKKFDQAESPFCLLSTDSSLDLVTILKLYAVRWQIETGYRYLKDLLGFDQYQMWSYKSVERYWCIQYLTYAYLEFQRQEWSQTQELTLGDTVRHIRMEHLGNLVVYVYQQALNHMPLYEVLAELKLTA